MRHLFLAILLLGCMQGFSQQRSPQIDYQDIAEMKFKNSLARETRQILNKADFGSNNFIKWIFYRYKIISGKSAIFELINPGRDSIDNVTDKVTLVVKSAFYHALDSAQERKEVNLLMSDNFVFIPVVIIYQPNRSERIKEELPLGVLEDAFGWGYDGELGNPKPILKILAPIVCNLPLTGKFY